jgi:hypothetical protein
MRASDRAAAADGGVLALGAAEVDHLRSFLRDSLLEELLRLYPSWGFCPRHAWGCALTELDFRGSVFTTAILYEHLLEAAVRVVSRRRRRWRTMRAYLTPYEDCYSCEHLASLDALGETPTGRAVDVGAREQSRSSLAEARGLWVGRACPLCAPGGGGVICRPHLVAGAERPPELSLALGELSRRLRRLVG